MKVENSNFPVYGKKAGNSPVGDGPGSSDQPGYHHRFSVQIMIRRRKIERFIESVKALPELITEFDESLWAALVDSMTVHGKDRITFRLTCGMEIEG